MGFASPLAYLQEGPAKNSLRIPGRWAKMNIDVAALAHPLINRLRSRTKVHRENGGMYCDFYGFQDRPFNLTPDPRFIFLSKHHREAFAHLLYGINNHVGFISVTGEVGSGKTTVLRALLNQLDAANYRTALIFNPPLSPSRLLRNIGREFGIPAGGAGNVEGNDDDLLEKLNEFLLAENAGRRTVVLVIDEAQNLSEEVLEQIRLISNLETDCDKLIQIILVGQPELLDLLKKKSMRQLNQRITVRHHLKPMDFKGTGAYINHRIEIAKGRVFFSRRALIKIFRYSKGLPRLINAACDRALLAGYVQNAKEISGRIAAVAVRDLERETNRHALKRPTVLYPILLTVIILAASPIFLYRAIKSGAINPPPVASEAVSKMLASPSDARTSNAVQPSFWPELERQTEEASLRTAVNGLLGLWQVDPLRADSSIEFRQLEDYFRLRGLKLFRFSGDLEGLRRTEYPAILELVFPGKAGKRYAALIGFKDEKIFLGNASPQAPLPRTDVEKYWTGQAYIPWRDFLKLPARIRPGARGKHITEIQRLLRETGIRIQPLTDSYDEEMQDAIKAFQFRNGIEADGIVGSRTLLLLYRSVERFGTPRMNG